MALKIGRSTSVPHTPGDRQQRMLAFMREHPVGVLCSVTPDGDPHGVVIYYTVGDDMAVRFLTKKRTRKYDNVKRHAHVMLTVFDARTQTTLQLTGVALEREGQDAASEVARHILDVPARTSQSGLPPIAKLQAGAFTTFVIEPLQVRMAVYGQPQAGDYNELFESVESFELNGSA